MEKLSARRESMASERLKPMRAKSSPAPTPQSHQRLYFGFAHWRALPGAMLLPLPSKHAAKKLDASVWRDTLATLGQRAPGFI